MKPRARLRRIAAGTLGALALGSVFVAALALGAVLHVGLAASRRLATTALNSAVRSSFRGDVELGSVEALSPTGARIAGLTVRAADGHELLRVAGIELEMGALREALAGELRVSTVTVESIQASLERGADGHLLLADALAPREEEAPAEPEEPEQAPTRPLAISFQQIHVARMALEGTLEQGATVHATLADVLLRVRVDGPTVTASLLRATVHEDALLPAPIDLQVNAEISLPPLSATGHVDGSVGSLDFGADVELRGDQLRLTVSAPSIEPGALTPFVRPVPRFALGSAALELWASSEGIRLAGMAALAGIGGRPPSTVTFSGHADLLPEPLFELAAKVSDFDARAVEPSLPETELSAEIAAHGVIGGDIDVTLHTAPGRVAGLPFPAAQGEAHVSRNDVSAWLHLEMPPRNGAATRRPWLGSASLLLSDGRLEARAAVDVPDIGELGALLPAGDLGARGSARAHAHVTMVDGAMEAAVRAELTRVEAGRLRATSGKLDATLHKPAGVSLAGATGDAELQLVGVRVGAYSLRWVAANAKGTLEQMDLAAYAADDFDRTMDLRGELRPLERTARNLALHLRRVGVEVGGTIALLVSDEGRVHAEGIELRGLGRGQIVGSLTVAGGEPIGRLEATDVDLAPLGRLLGLRQPLRGHADLSARFERGLRADVQLALRGGGFLLLDGLDATVGLTRGGRTLRASGTASLAGNSPNPHDACSHPIAELSLRDAELDLDGVLLDSASYSQAALRAAFDLKNLRIGCFEAPLALALPLRRLAGSLDLSLAVARAAGERRLSLPRVGLRTRGLEFDVGDDDSAQAIASDRLDASLDASVTAAGDCRADLVVLAPNRSDAPLAHLTASARIDLGDVFANPAVAVNVLRGAPIAITLHTGRIEAHALDALPPGLRALLPELTGALQLDAVFEGSLNAPRAAARVRTYALALRDVGGDTPWAPMLTPLDLDAIASYARSRGWASAAVGVGGKTLGRVGASLEGDLVAIIERRALPVLSLSTTIEAETLDALGEVIGLPLRQRLTGGLSWRLPDGSPDLGAGRAATSPAERAAVGVDIRPGASNAIGWLGDTSWQDRY